MHKFSSSLKEKKKDGLVPVIVDFKCISPGEGRLFDEKDAVRNALKMIEAGEAAGRLENVLFRLADSR